MEPRLATALWLTRPDAGVRSTHPDTVRYRLRRAVRAQRRAERARARAQRAAARRARRVGRLQGMADRLHASVRDAALTVMA